MVFDADITVHGENDDEMWFLVGGAIHYFSKQEFTLVTWLKFGTISISLTDLDDKPLDENISRLFCNARNMKINGNVVGDVLWN